MKTRLTLEQIKERQLFLLEIIHQFCIENDINYFLMYGTLIGSIRHKGYIPWDDDIDLCMPRPDYEKFSKIFNGSHNGIEFVTFDIDKNFLYTFGKVVDTNTIVIETSLIKYDLGINIDIFPIDGVDREGKILKKQIFLRNLLNVKSIKLSSNRSLIKNTALFILQTLLKPIPTKILVSRMIKNARSNNYAQSTFVSSATMGTKLNKPVPKEYFEYGILKEFEGKDYFVPVGYDSYLRSIFGDYMQLPPPEKRVSHHAYEAYEKE